MREFFKHTNPQTQTPSPELPSPEFPSPDAPRLTNPGPRHRLNAELVRGSANRADPRPMFLFEWTQVPATWGNKREGRENRPRSRHCMRRTLLNSPGDVEFPVDATARKIRVGR